MYTAIALGIIALVTLILSINKGGIKVILNVVRLITIVAAVILLASTVANKIGTKIPNISFIDNLIPKELGEYLFVNEKTVSSGGILVSYSDLQQANPKLGVLLTLIKPKFRLSGISVRQAMMDTVNYSIAMLVSILIISIVAFIVFAIIWAILKRRAFIKSKGDRILGFIIGTIYSAAIVFFLLYIVDLLGSIPYINMIHDDIDKFPFIKTLYTNNPIKLILAKKGL